MMALREERLRNPHGTAIRMAIQAARINGQSDQYIKEEVLAPMVGTIPAGTYLLVEQDYDSEDDNDSLLQGLEKEGWAYPIPLWTDLLDAFHQWQDEQEMYRGLTEGFDKIRAVRQTGLSKALKAIMPEGWEVNRREYVEPDEARGFYITVA
jgi:hypothetical protein